jgi:hypothetical protein
MYFGLPFLIAAVPGVLALLLTYWFNKRKLHVFVRVLPSLLVVGGAIFSFYYGIEVVRGFEGGMFLILSIFLILFAIAGFFMVGYSQGQKINNYSMSSVILFVVSFLIYSMWFSFESLFNDPLALIIGIGFPVAGLLIAFRGKGKLKVVGILGNIFVITFIVIIPVASTLFWNQP